MTEQVRGSAACAFVFSAVSAIASSALAQTPIPSQATPLATPAMKPAAKLKAKTREVMTRATVTYQPIPFTELPGWAADDHLAAFGAFVKSCTRIAKLTADRSPKFEIATPVAQALVSSCAATLATAPQIKTAAAARAFFEQRFTANRVVHNGASGLLTGYYEPVLKGARTPQGPFKTPIYRRPPDLVNLVEESQRGAVGQAFTHARQTARGPVPYATRADIEQGALKGQGLELLYLDHPVDVFFLQIQGSGQIELPDRTRIRVSYDGKNGHPYTSVGRYLIDNNIIDANRMTLQALGDWLKADTKRGQQAMWQNKSYVFFRELQGEEASAALGVLDIPLTPGRSLAVDGGYHTLGLPVYVSSSALTHATPKGGFHRLMVAQDVGSAIKGPERGDLYFGSGDDAGKLAGVTKHPGTFYVLAPLAPPASASLRPTVTGTLPTTAAPAQKKP